MNMHKQHPQRCLHSHICKFNGNNYQDCINTDCASHRYTYNFQSERDAVPEDLEKDMHEHYDFVAAQYNIQGGAYYRGIKELYEQIFEKLVELQCSKREGQG